MININRLHNIKNTIENLNKNYQLEILKILLQDESVVTSENNNGTFVNLSDLNNITINKLESFIEYVKKQQINLSCIEEEKVNIKNEFFNKKNNEKIIKKEKNINNLLNAK